MEAFVAIIVICLIFGVAAALSKAFSKPRKPNPNGSNDWIRYLQSRPETRGGLTTGKGVRLGVPVYPEMCDAIRDASDRHIITFGPTGSGKNATMQTPALLDYDGSALVIDVKGQLAAITAFHRQSEFKQDIYVLNPFDSLGLPSCTYNPLRFIDPESRTFASDARRLAEGLVIITKGDHWETAALDLVTLLIMWTVLYEEEKNLVTVRRLLNLPEGAPNDECTRQGFFTEMSKCRRSDIAEGAIRYTLDSKEVIDCIQTAVVQLSFMRDEAIATTLSGGDREISFADLKRKGATAYVIIPPELLHTHGRFLRLVLMSALSEFLREPARPARPVLFMIDEFAALGPMPIIENAASIVRDYGIKIWFVLQNLPQLKNLYGKQWESFLSAAGVVQFFTPADLETAKYVSDRSGLKKVFRETTSETSTQTTNSGTTSGGSNYGSSSQGTSQGTSSSSSRAEQYEPSLLISDVFATPPHYQYLLVPGVNEAVEAWRGEYWGIYKNTPIWDAGLDPYHMDNQTRARFDEWMRSGETFFHRVCPHDGETWERLGFSSQEKAAAIWGAAYEHGPFLPKPQAS